MDAKHMIARACTQSPQHVNVADCRAPNCLSREAAFNICQLEQMFSYLQLDNFLLCIFFFPFLPPHVFGLNAKSHKKRKKVACLRYPNFSLTPIGLELQTYETSEGVIQKKEGLIHNKSELDRLAQCGIHRSVIRVIHVFFKMLKKGKFSRTADLSYDT